MDAREERIARNEVLFREVNERITELADPPREARIEIFCECGLDDCTERIEVAVRDYEMVHGGRDSFPLLSLEVHFIDASTGRLVWSASRTRKGGPALPLFGWTEVRTMGELTASMCRELLSTLPKG